MVFKPGNETEKEKKRTSQKPTFLPLLLTMRSVLAVALVDPAQEKNTERMHVFHVYRYTSQHTVLVQHIPISWS